MTDTTDNYRQYLCDMLRIYSYFDQGKFESEEADKLRDEMEKPWYTLTEAEQKRIRGLAQDLNYIREAQRPLIGPLDRGRDTLGKASELRNLGQLDKALELLRLSQNEIHPPSLSLLRGRIWLDLEAPRVALEFLREAWRLDRTNHQIEAMYLQVSRDIDVPKLQRT